MNLIRHLLEHKKIKFGKVLDWWLTDDKFNSWDKADVGRFTKKLHKMEGFSKERDLRYSAAKSLTFPKKASRYPQIWIAKGSSEGRDWVRHIRNGIAHGHSTVRKTNNDYVVEILDYKTDKTKEQTAYILIPLYYLQTIMNCYIQVDKRR